MGWIVVIEENSAFSAAIADAFAQIDPKLVTMPFRTSIEFLDWMEKLEARDPELAPTPPSDKFLGIVTAIEAWKFKDVRLIGKFKALFVQRKLAATEEDLFVVFTGFETSGFKRKRFEYRSVNNVVFKPFDKLLLKQMLEIAVKGRQPVKAHETHVLKTHSEIEMLKEIQLASIGEASLKTFSDQNIQPGTIAKYYADFFETNQHRSALAQAIGVESKNSSYEITLRFFALDQMQSFKIQKLVQVHKQTTTLRSSAPHEHGIEFVFVKHDTSALVSELQPSVERFYSHTSSQVSTLADLSRILEQKPATKILAFIDHIHLAGNEIAEIQALHKLHPQLGIHVLCKQIFSESLERELSTCVEDIYYAPFNRSYIIKSLKLRYPALATKEEIFENIHSLDSKIYVSSTVQLLEVSEADLVINYHRPLPIGSFREFVFKFQNEVEVPTLVAQCNFTEKAQDGKSYNCHFVFFGLRDHELKFIRRWMLLEYVEAKQDKEV